MFCLELHGFENHDTNRNFRSAKEVVKYRLEGSVNMDLISKPFHVDANKPFHNNFNWIYNKVA